MHSIKNYEGLYSIDKNGKVYSHAYARDNGKGGWYWSEGRYLKARNSKGCQYFNVVLRKDGNVNQKYIHRLLAETFIPNPNNYKYVNHKDGDKQNNSLDNLEWCTKSHDLLHKYRTGLETKKINHKTAETIRMLYKNNKDYITQKDLAIVYGLSQGYISEIVNNKKQQAIREVYK